MSINDLTLKNLDLGKQQIEKENEIKQLFKVLNDSKINNSLLSGRDFWVKHYNQKVKDYKSFCDENTLKASILIRVIK